MEVSVAPAPGSDGDILVVSNSMQQRRSSLDDEDMMNDAVMLEFEAAEQLVELQRQMEQKLALQAHDDGQEAGAGDSPASTTSSTQNGKVYADRAKAAASDSQKLEEEVPDEFLASNFWRARLDIDIDDELQS